MSLSLFPETIKLDLLHPITKEPIGFVLELVGTDHDDVYQAQLDVVKSLRSKGTKDPAEFALSLDTKIKVATACIVGWSNTSEDIKTAFKKLGFEDDSFSQEKAAALLSMKTASWIRSQIEEAIGDKERFFQSVSNG